MKSSRMEERRKRKRKRKRKERRRKRKGRRRRRERWSLTRRRGQRSPCQDMGSLSGLAVGIG